MKPEDHTHFFSELHDKVDQLLTLVKEYYEQVLEHEDKTICGKECIEKQNEPF